MSEVVFGSEGVFPFYCTFHATPDGKVGMTGVVVVGDVRYIPPTGERGVLAPVDKATGVTRRVPEDYPTIQNAVDAANPGDLVLDPFAGSGTTAHAVLALNKKDGGNRKFILVETEDYADQLTAERDDAPVFRRIIEVNVVALFDTFAAFLPAMRERGSGTLVGIASVAGIRGLPGAGAYSASKSAAITYLESLRLEERPFGLKVVTIAPGYIRTPKIGRAHV